MYCPICFNDTLKLSSSGVVKLSFNGKTRATTQFFYNIDKDSSDEIHNKLSEAIKDFYKYYSNFTNKELIDNVQVFSRDFKCSNSCSMSIEHKVNVMKLIVAPEELITRLEALGKRYSIEMNLETIKANLK